MKIEPSSIPVNLLEKVGSQSKEERLKAALRKLSLEMEANQGSIKEPDGFASGAIDKNAKMIIDLEEDYDDERD